MIRTINKKKNIVLTTDKNEMHLKIYKYGEQFNLFIHTLDSKINLIK